MAIPNYQALSASNGNGEAVRATVQVARTVGSTSITVNAITNWPTGPFIATTGTLQASGILNPTTVQVFYGTASGTTITITAFAPGYTDKGNAVSDVVVLKPSTEWANIVSGMFAGNITNANLSGTAGITGANIAPATVTSANIAPATVTSANIAPATVTSANILAGTIVGNNIAAGTLTGDKLAGDTVTGNNLVGINLFGVGSAAVGAPPARLSGQFYIQSGSQLITFNTSSVGTLDFAVAFPNGVVAVIPVSGDSGNPLSYQPIESSLSVSGLNLVCYNGTTGAGTITTRVNWIAIGF